MSDRRQDKNVLFHVFPGSSVTKTGGIRNISQDEQDTRKKWIHAIRRGEKDTFFTIVPHSTVVYSEHFKDDAYVQC